MRHWGSTIFGNIHYIYKNNEFFEDLFFPDNNLRRCEKCMMEFKNSRVRINHMFLLHCNQSRGSRINQQLPVNVVKQGQITHYSINFDPHEKFYNFSEESIVDDFDSVYAWLVPVAQVSIQGYDEIINQQQGEILYNKRVWLTDVYRAKCFNSYVRCALKNDILKWIIFNGETGSSWIFKRFQRLQIITTSFEVSQSLFSGWSFLWTIQEKKVTIYFLCKDIITLM